jgi:hypothetical protein
MSLMVAMWQGLETGAISAGNTRWLMIFVGLVAASMVAQVIIFAFMAYGAKKAQERVLVIAEEIHKRAMPVIAMAEDLSKETLPKVKVITENILQTSYVVRAKAEEFDTTLTDANQRARAQVARVDGMVSTGLTKTGQIAEMIHQGIRKPVIEISGLINGLKAGIDVLTSRAKGFAGRGPVTRNDVEY